MCPIILSFRSDETPDSTDKSYKHKGQTLYLVFESALLLLFSSCLHCSGHTRVNKVVIGSFLRIIQTCSRCRKILVWESQPYIGKIPAGNILTSAAILYSGALPSKALKCSVFSMSPRSLRRLFFAIRTSIYSQQLILLGKLVRSCH